MDVFKTWDYFKVLKVPSKPHKSDLCPLAYDEPLTTTQNLTLTHWSHTESTGFKGYLGPGDVGSVAGFGRV